MKNLKSIFILSYILFTLQSNIYSQGKIFTKDEANKLFGTVKYSIQIDQAKLSGLVSKANQKIMFAIVNKKLFVRDNKKEIFYSEGNEDLTNVIFHVYSTSIVNELLSKENNDVIYIEQRDSVLTITSGNYTLEKSDGCPPVCD